MKKILDITIFIGRLGPAENLRPAGAHKNKKRENRAAVKAALRKADE